MTKLIKPCASVPSLAFSGLKLHTVASDELELWRNEIGVFNLKPCVTIVLYGDCSLWDFPTHFTHP